MEFRVLGWYLNLAFASTSTLVLTLTLTLVLILASALASTFGFVYAFSMFGFFSFKMVSLFDNLPIFFVFSLCNCFSSDFF